MSDTTQNKWQVLCVAGTAVVLTLTTWYSATAVAPELAAHLSLDPATASWLTNCVQAGFVTGALVSSFLALTDIWPLTRIMSIAALATALANAMLLFAHNAETALVARFVTGAALALVYPPSLKFIGTWFKAGRGMAMGGMVGALTLGSAMPYLVRGFGLDLDWQLVIAATSFASVLAAFLFLFFLREGPYPFARTVVDPRQIGAIIRNRPVMLANFGYFGHMWELYAMWGWFLAFATSAVASGNWPLNASLLAFCVVAIGAPGCLLGGYLADRFGRCATTILMLAISGCCALLIGVFFHGPLPVFVAVALVWGITVVADSAQFTAAVTELSDQALVGSSLAFQMGVGFAITIFVIWLIPHFAAAIGGWRWTFLLLVPGPVFGLLAMWRLRLMPEAAVIAAGRR